MNNNNSVLNSQQKMVLSDIDSVLLSTRMLLCNESNNNNNSNSTITSNTNTNDVENIRSDNGISDNDIDDDETTTKRQKIKLTLQDVNLIFGMPFFCTIGTRLPFIYFVIELKERYGMDMTSIALCIGAFHLCRVFAIIGSIFATKTSHFIGTIIGIGGYTGLLITAGTSNVALFASCNIVTGFAESSAAVFVYSKQDYSTNVDKMKFALSNQSAFIGVAVILGFFFGGILFQLWGVSGIAMAGIIVLGWELLSFMYYLAPKMKIDHYSGNGKKSAPDADEEEDDDGHENEGNNFVGKSTIRASIGDTVERNAMLNQFSAEEAVKTTKFTYLVAVVFSIESIACGYLFSIGPLFIFEQFGVDQGKIGTIFSCASLFGTLLTYIAISQKGRKLQKKYVRSPYNLYILITTITLSVLGLLIPNFIVQVVCIMLLIGCCELFLTLLSEVRETNFKQHEF